MNLCAISFLGTSGRAVRKHRTISIQWYGTYGTASLDQNQQARSSRTRLVSLSSLPTSVSIEYNVAKCGRVLAIPLFPVFREDSFILRCSISVVPWAQIDHHVYQGLIYEWYQPHSATNSYMQDARSRPRRSDFELETVTRTGTALSSSLTLKFFNVTGQVSYRWHLDFRPRGQLMYSCMQEKWARARGGE